MRIVNIRDYSSFDEIVKQFGEDKVFYVGRANARYGVKDSVLANPFRVQDFGREQAITMYSHYLFTLVVHVKEVREYLASLPDDAVLVCWCHPEPCHANTIIDMYNRLPQLSILA